MEADDLYGELEHICADNDIVINNLPGAPFDVPTAQRIFYKGEELKFINLNPNFVTKYHPLVVLGHEVGHLVAGDPTSQEIYAFSPLAKRTEERIANTWIIQFLARHAFDDVPPEYMNWANFMHSFGLPSEFEPTVKNVIKAMM